MTFSLWRNGLAAFVCGLGFAYCFPPTSFYVLVPLSLCGLIALVGYSSGLRAAFAIGFAFGCGQFLVNFLWIANAFAVREGFSYSQGVAATAALSVGMALYPALACVFARWCSGSGFSSWFVLALSGSWTLLEIARGTFFTGFPWNPIGALWGPISVLAQGASIIGVYGLSFLTLLCAGGFLLAVTQWHSNRKYAAIFGAGTMALVISWSCYGFLQLRSGPAPVRDDVVLLGIQANIAQEDKWRSELLSSHVEAHIKLSRGALQDVREGVQPIVIWPETAYPFIFDNYVYAQRDLQRRLGADVALIFGGNRFLETSGARTARNSMFILKDGRLQATYDKHHLVPFGEYLPLAPLLRRLGFETMVNSLSAFSSGPGPQTLKAGGVPPFIPLICYEGVFPSAVVGLQDRADWILNISNDAWFGVSSGPAQHLNLVRFRAIEQGLPLVRVTGTGISAVFDPQGRVIAKLDLGQQAAFSSVLPKPKQARTLFAVFGISQLVFVCFFILIVVTAYRKLLKMTTVRMG